MKQTNLFLFFVMTGLGATVALHAMEPKRSQRDESQRDESQRDESQRNSLQRKNYGEFDKEYVSTLQDGKRYKLFPDGTLIPLEKGPGKSRHPSPMPARLEKGDRS